MKSGESHPAESRPPVALPQPIAARLHSVWWALGLAALALGLFALLWVRLNSVQELLARQSSDSGLLATEARASARQAEDLARDSAARLALAEAKITELNLQRVQLEQLMQNLSRSREDNLVADLEAALRMADQQTQLTGSLQPLVTALRSVELRLAKQVNPKFGPLRRAIAHDLDKLTVTGMPDTPGMLARLDVLVGQMDLLPLLNSVGRMVKPEPESIDSAGWQRAISRDWWSAVVSDLWGNLRGLIRISRIDQPDAALLAPEQSFFLRENLKLRLLNVRLGLLSRQFDSARIDLQTAQRDLGRYFDIQSRSGRQAVEQLQQMQGEIRQIRLPRMDETMAALETLVAGR